MHSWLASLIFGSSASARGTSNETIIAERNLGITTSPIDFAICQFYSLSSHLQDKDWDFERPREETASTTAMPLTFALGGNNIDSVPFNKLED
jgi:hypothetical protein